MTNDDNDDNIFQIIKTMTTKTKQTVMRRVYAIWFMRSVAPLIALEVVVFFVAANVLASNVFVDKTISNALLATLGNPMSLVVYFLNAFAKTQFLTQTAIFLFALVGVSFMRDVARSIASYSLVKRNQFFRVTL